MSFTPSEENEAIVLRGDTKTTPYQPKEQYYLIMVALALALYLVVWLVRMGAESLKIHVVLSVVLMFLVGIVPPLIWPRRVARIPLFLLFLKFAFLPMFIGFVLGCFGKRALISLSSILAACIPLFLLALGIASSDMGAVGEGLSLGSACALVSAAGLWAVTAAYCAVLALGWRNSLRTSPDD